MSDETGAVGKGFPTFLASIRLFSSVCFLVLQKVGAAVKSLSTLVTLKGLFTSVNSLVFGDI